MNSDKKQTTPIVILGILLAVCAGYAVFKLTGKKTPAPSQEPKSAVTQASSRPAESRGAQPEYGAFEYDVAPVGAGRDPFVPSITPESERSKPTVVRLKRATRPVLPNMAALPPLGAVPRSLAGLLPFGEEQATQPDFSVTGVVLGEKNVAIVHSGSGDRQIVHEGQQVGGYKVLSITKGGVVLKGDGRTLHVKLGGGKNAS